MKYFLDSVLTQFLKITVFFMVQNLGKMSICHGGK